MLYFVNQLNTSHTRKENESVMNELILWKCMIPV